jgi:hypothetical protein
MARQLSDAELAGVAGGGIFDDIRNVFEVGIDGISKVVGGTVNAIADAPGAVAGAFANAPVPRRLP